MGALAPPLDALAERSFAVHMVQHELLMVVAAPLLVLGRPLEAWAWALPLAARRALAAVSREPVVQAAWRALTMPVGAWSVHAVALWTWHLPLLFVAALSNPALHVLQHACFFASALVPLRFLISCCTIFSMDARRSGSRYVCLTSLRMMCSTGTRVTLIEFSHACPLHQLAHA